MTKYTENFLNQIICGLTLRAACFSLYLTQLRGRGVGNSHHPPQYLKIHKWYKVKTFTRHISWQKMTIDDVAILVTWLGDNLQTRNKMGNRYPISGFPATVLISNFVRYIRVTKESHPWPVTWQSRDLDTIPDWIENRVRFCISSSICTIDFNFVRYVGVT